MTLAISLIDRRQLSGLFGVRNGEPALKSVYDAMQEEGWTTNELTVEESLIVLTVGSGGANSFVYRLSPPARPLAAYTASEAPETRRSMA